MLNSVPVAVETFLLLAIWSRYLSSKIKAAAGEGISRAIFINVLAATSFSAAFHFAYGQESFQATLLRIAGLQFFIFLIFALNLAILGAIRFLGWLTIKLGRQQLARRAANGPQPP
jgi:hypothetical protein